MPQTMGAQHSRASRIRVLGTGGTIAGTAPAGSPDNRYKPGQVSIQDLLKPLLATLGQRVAQVEAVQVAQLDSRNMGYTVWQALAAELQAGMDDPAVVGQVVTHGTDTLEETAVFLHGVLRGRKPVVLTAAMRPATSAMADGPDNLRQALLLAAHPQAFGVWMAFGGKAWPAVRVRKVHPFALQAFCAGDGAAQAQWLDEAWVWGPGAAPSSQQGTATPDSDEALVCAEPVQMPDDVKRWPRVEVVHSHAGADGHLVDLMLSEANAGGVTPQGLWGRAVQGLVVSATGNGSIHESIHEALQRAVASGRLHRQHILVATRCTQGWVVGEPEHGWPVASRLTPAQARVALMLQLVASQVPAGASSA